MSLVCSGNDKGEAGVFGRSEFAPSGIRCWGKSCAAGDDDEAGVVVVVSAVLAPGGVDEVSDGGVIVEGDLAPVAVGVKMLRNACMSLYSPGVLRRENEIRERLAASVRQ